MHDDTDTAASRVEPHRAVLGPDDTTEVSLHHPMGNIVRYNRKLQILIVVAVMGIGFALAYSLHHSGSLQPSFQSAPPLAAGFASPGPEPSSNAPLANNTGIPTPNPTQPPTTSGATSSTNPDSRRTAAQLTSAADRLDADLAHGTGGSTTDLASNTGGSTSQFSPPPVAPPQAIPQQVPEPGAVVTPPPHLTQAGFYIGDSNYGQTGTSTSTPSLPPSTTTSDAQRSPEPTSTNPAVQSAAQRITWANGDSAQAPYLTAVEVPAASRDELWAGSTIPAELDSGINTDLPGPVIAHVTDNVYDSRTQHDLLIPRGTRILGRYNSQITVGQARVQVAWDELIFPDGRTLEIGGMPGATTEGDSGLYADVNNHIGTIITTTIITGLLTGASALAQSGQTVEINPVTGQEENLSPTTALTEGLAQSTANTGGDLIRAKANQPPELTVPKGERFLVVVDKILVLEAYIPDKTGL